MSVIGKYVKTFAEASHALPDGMHMNSDYPLMLPAIVRCDAKTVTLLGRDGEVTLKIRPSCRVKGNQVAFHSITSSYEVLFDRPPQRFCFMPFKDDNTPIPGAHQPDLC